MKTKIIIPLKLIDGIGYDHEEVAKMMKKQGRLREWKKFAFGSTGAISKDGKFLVYKWDVEGFIEGQPEWLWD